MPVRLSDRDLRLCILDELIAEIKFMEDKFQTPEWGAYLRHMSARNWVNKEIDALADLMVDNWDDIFRRKFRESDDDDIAVREYVPSMVEGHMAYVVINSKDLAYDLEREDRRTYDDYREFARAWGDTFLRGNGNRNNYQDTRRDSRDDRRSVRDSRDSRDSRSYGRQDDRSRRPVRDDRSHGRDDRSRRPEPPTSAWSDLPPSAVQEPVQRQVVAPVVTEVRQVRQTLSDGPDYSQAEPHLRYSKDGKYYELCVVSKMVPTPIKKDGLIQPRLAYDPFSELKYYVQQEDGTVVEEIVKLTEDNQYLQHRTVYDHQPQRQTRRSTTLQRRTNEDESVADSKPEVRKVDSVAEIFANKVITSDDEETVCDSIDVIAANLVMDLAKVVEGEAPAISALRHGIVRTPLMLRSPVDTQHAFLERFAGASTLVDAANILSSAEGVDVTVRDYLNTEMTRRLMQALRYQFQYPHIEDFDFIRDYNDELIPHLRDTGEDELLRQLSNRCQALPAMVAENFSNDPAELHKWFPNEFPTPEDATKFTGIFMGKRVFVMRVSLTMDELGLGRILDIQEPLSENDLGVGCHHLRNSQELVVSLQKLYSSIKNSAGVEQKDINLTSIQVVTADNLSFNVLPHVADQNQFILFLNK